MTMRELDKMYQHDFSSGNLLRAWVLAGQGRQRAKTRENIAFWRSRENLCKSRFNQRRAA